jgi:cellulose synthase/poly-beta-1,6-N-acetylglucosamine synthase-like glycosyltransferase
MALLFGLGFLGVGYAYFGYPLVLWVWGRVRPNPVKSDDAFTPAVSIILPVHNEAAGLEAKLTNLLELDYPDDRLEVCVVSDGSTDETVSIARAFEARCSFLRVIGLEMQGGKAGALNVGLRETSHEIVVFTDAGIMLEPQSLRELVRPFADPSIGCASGEDRVTGGGGEALYGRYELFLRRRESAVASIVGASGSYYAQRRELCATFPEGIAPDFLSVLRTVERGFRAVTVPGAGGTMRATTSHGKEFQRKVRTLVRGMTGLFGNTSLLNPLKTGTFAFLLFSHKVMRWLVPLFLVAMLVSHLFLLDSPLFRLLAIPHFGFYLLGVLGLLGPGPLRRSIPVRITAYFVTVHAAILVAWWRYIKGIRQEVWSPTVRS